MFSYYLMLFARLHSKPTIAKFYCNSYPEPAISCQELSFVTFFVDL